MKEAIVRKDIVVDVIDSPIPTPNDDQVIIKVIVSGSNPKDWKTVEWLQKELNNGDDIAGTIHSVGANVTEFKPGDRVAAFHEMREPGGSYAEYAVAWAHTTFHLPKKTSYEEASTIPLAGMTAALGLFNRLRLPQPWTPASEPIPLIIYGAASAVGAFGVKLAGQANIHPMICVAGRGMDFVKSIPGFDASKGDTVVDYRDGDDALVRSLKDALKKGGIDKVSYALDATSEKGSWQNIGKVLDPHGAITSVLPCGEYEGVPRTVKTSMTMVGSVHGPATTNYGKYDDDRDFGQVYFRHFARGLQTGTFSGHPYEVREGGLGGIQQALRDLKAGKASATKYIFKIADTEGVGKD